MAYNYLNKVGLTNLWGNIKAYITSKLSSKANDSDVVHKSEYETITGPKTFNNSLVKTGSGNWGNILTLKNIGTIKSTAPDNTTINNAIRFASSDYNDTYSATEAEITVQKLTTGDNCFTLAISSNSNTSASGMASLSLYSDKRAFWDGAFTATTFNGDLVGNATTATSATKAVQDGNGNVITDTYATKTDLSGKANDADVVHASGDETVDGTKTFTSNVTNKITTYAVTDTPTSNTYRYYLFLDKNDTILGFLQYASRTTGVRDLSLYVTDKDRSTHGIQINSENYVLPIGNNSYYLGSTTSKWKSAYINSMISANITLSDPNFLRCTYGSYGSFWRQNGTNLLLLITNENDQYGTCNSFRPIQVNLSTGKCYINGVDPSANGDDVVGKTVTAYYTTASLSGRSDRDFSGNSTQSLSTKTNTMTPTVGTIYSGAQLYAIAVGKGSWSKSGNVSENNIHINQVLNSLLEFTGQYSSSAKYLCTTAQGVYNTSSGSSTLTNYRMEGGYTSTGTITNGAITNTIGGGKSTFLRVQ